MKKLNLFAIATLALCWAGCSNNDEASVKPEDVSGEKSAIALVIKNTSASKTRNATGQEGATGTEINLDATKGLKVAIFKTDGGLSSTHTLTLTDNGNSTYTSNEFEALSGRKYIYVFANDANSNIVLPAPATLMADFQRQVINVAYDVNGTPDIAGSLFLLGSLWADKVNIPIGGVTGTPNTLNLEIGRLAAKITMSSLVNEITNRGGEFDVASASYRVGSVARKINTVGFHIGEPLPTVNPNITVQSAVHSAASWTTADTDNYKMFNVSLVAAKAVKQTAQEYFYITENTTGSDAFGMQYYGNTTFIQFAVQYKPDVSEIYDPTTLLSASLTGSTFWTARIKNGASLGGKWLIFNANPTTGLAHADIELTEIREYTDGICYYKFPVQDKNESSDICKYRVLRNHIYDFKVTAIKELGEPTAKVDPQEPITEEENTYIVVEVSVQGWDKVETDDIEV